MIRLAMTFAIFLTHTEEALTKYYGGDALSALRRLGAVRLNTLDRVLDSRDLRAQARGCPVIIADRQTPLPRAVFEGMDELIAVLRCAMDIRSIDVAAAERAGVLVTRASAGFIDAVAELAVGFMIDLARGISDASLCYRANVEPVARTGVQLAGSTIGIIGYGAIGKRLGILAKALKMTVLASDPHQTIGEPGIEQLDLENLLKRAKFVVCLAPATPETTNLMNARAFALMPPGSYLLNLARGSLVDEAALERALASGPLAGAALDVGSAPDQKPASLLAGHPNVVATPHIGGLTPEAVAHQAFDTVRQVAALAERRIPEGAVNARLATRLARIGIVV